MISMSVTVQGGRLEFDKKMLRATMRAAGSEVAAQARVLVSRSGGSGRLYRGRKSSSPGEAPVRLSGLLSRSFKVRVFKSGEGVAIRDTAFYAKFLETGAQGGGGDTHNQANILLAGEKGRFGRILRGKSRMKKTAINQSRVLLPRPYLTTALGMREASIRARVAASLNNGLKFERTKVSRKP
jgi:hypothetical protein